MVSRSKYKQVSDLYVEGTELELRNGLVLWMQVLNPFEVDEARNAAQVAKARMVLALKTQGSDELGKLEAKFQEAGRDRVIEEMVNARSNELLVKVLEEIEDDPEWTESRSILEREDELKARPETDPERKLLEDLNVKYVQEIQKRLQDEEEWATRELETLDDDALLERFKEMWIEHRGGDRAMAEYHLTEVYHAARACEGVQGDDGVWDHSECEAHRLLAFEDREEVRSLPEPLQTEMQQIMIELNMSTREGKDSGSPASSSDSSALPSEQEASTPSTPTETPSVAPGT